MRHARSKIPLVIGGWGTRGKSGTERLKAALFTAMGLSVVSKTTGCEAMFLFGPANRPMKEMFLFRPYDKASIWEQVFLTRLTAKLGADVFLWECMGLTPRYIDIIQNQWMRDDISTITNCYPDHEDLQGPAGIEIPIVMQRFVPKNSVLVASEESMLPLLEDAALQKNSTLLAVTWLESGLLTDDVIARFPYEEHPNNIALVAQMADTLDIPQDFAIKEMADNVVADLGVLKIYPQVQVQQRNMIFINGMSANERLGAMGNWQRTGLAEQDLASSPEQWLSIVINNRADRVARSKVFATMLVQDTQADCYFFIGDNLGGLTNYILEAWHGYTNKLELDSVERFRKQALKFRIATKQEQVLRRLQAAVAGVSDIDPKLVDCIPEKVDQSSLANWCLPDSINVSAEVAHAITMQFKRDAAEYLEFKHFEKQFDAEIKQPMLDWLLACFKRRWVILDDYYSKGNQTINTLVKHTPPGLLSRTIGVQNIKGTGLDFIYRWQFWDRVHQYCEILLSSRDEMELSETLKSLTTWEEFGLLEEQKVGQTLRQVKKRSEAQTEHIQAQLYIVEQRLAQQLAAVSLSLEGARSQSKVWRWLINAIEAFLDAGDAIKRRKKADKIYQAMLDNLISYDKASLELAKITQDQKGGWMSERMKRVFEQDK
jgi:poly-gamma-glutamate synthase PgsB/CapB